MYENLKEMIRSAGCGMSISRYETILNWIYNERESNSITEAQKMELLELLSKC